MSTERIAARAYMAIEQTLSAQLKRDLPLSEKWKTVVSNTIEQNIHLIARADNANVAYVEIAADAAMEFLDGFNAENPGYHIKPGWFYRVVQANLMQNFMPDMLKEPAPRLKDSFGFNAPGNMQQKSQSMQNAEPVSQTTVTHHAVGSDNNLETMTRPDIQENASSSKNRAESGSSSGDQGPSLNSARMAEEHWDEKQTMELIHMYLNKVKPVFCARSLGRSKESVELRWAHVSTAEEWKAIIKGIDNEIRDWKARDNME